MKQFNWLNHGMQLIKKRFALSWNDNIVILLLMAKKKKKEISGLQIFPIIFFYILALPVAHVIVIYTVQNI